MIRNRLNLTSVLAALALASCTASTPTQKGHEMKMAATSPEQIQKIMQQAGQPAEQHEFLHKLVGEWDVESKWRMSPQEEFVPSKATVSRKLVLNKLFLMEEYHDKSEQQPFSGIGMMGYDKVTKEYTSNWYDTMSSATWTSTGKIDSKGATISFNGGGSCPMTGTQKIVDSEFSMVDANTQTYKMYDTTADGVRFLSMELTYKRKA